MCRYLHIILLQNLHSNSIFTSILPLSLSLPLLLSRGGLGQRRGWAWPRF
uniref:Uncharacterized protein n=1 Tax=Anguilla anguilla TaxID=7936 RepID=A0A0E9VJK5_ANGAN